MGLMNFYGNLEGYDGRIGFLDLWRKSILKKLKRDNSSYRNYIRPYNSYKSENATMSGKE